MDYFGMQSWGQKENHLEISVKISSSFTIALSAFFLMSFILVFFWPIATHHAYKVQKQNILPTLDINSR